jgi:hypothetical protein
MGGGDVKADEILKSARATGFTFTVADGKLKVRGVGSRKDRLVEAIRMNKSEIISIIRVESANEAKKAKQGASNPLVPGPTELPVPDVISRFTAGERGLLIDRVMFHGMSAIGWCMVRANAYFEKHPESAFEEQDAAAAWDYLDLIGWRGE